MTDEATEEAPAKICTGCGRNVAGQTRMKDAEGQYWCATCGELEQRRQRLENAGLCAGCGESFPPAKLTEIAKLPFCDSCLRLRPAEIHAKKSRKGSFFKSRREMVLTCLVLSCLFLILLYKIF